MLRTPHANESPAKPDLGEFSCVNVMSVTFFVLQARDAKSSYASWKITAKSEKGLSVLLGLSHLGVL